jgi:DNA damage-binding protein 1
LRESFESKHDKFLVESFVGETRALAIEDEQLDEVELKAFDQTQTLFCCNVINDLILQITANNARLVSNDGQTLVSTWSPPSGVTISVAHANATQALIATAGCKLVLLSIENRELKQINITTLDNEVSCIDVSPITPDTPLSTTYAAIGMWKEIGVRVVALPSFKELNRAALGGEIVPRSVMFARFDTVSLSFLT